MKTENNKYIHTLNTPLQDDDPSAFKQKIHFSVLEEEIQEEWVSKKVFNEILIKGNILFQIHDSPTYCTGKIHLGHVLNKVSKDFIFRHKSMQGKCADYAFSWNNYDPKVETIVTRKLQENKASISNSKIREECRSYAEECAETQKIQFKKLGISLDWKNCSFTTDASYEAMVVETFGKLYEKGYIYCKESVTGRCDSCGLDASPFNATYCWKCSKKLNFEASEEWFLKLDHNNLRQRCILDLHNIEWYPEDNMSRMRSIIENSSDLCLSKNKKWGIGVPVYCCEICDGYICDVEITKAIAHNIRIDDRESWWNMDAAGILSEYDNDPSRLCPRCNADVESWQQVDSVLDSSFISSCNFKNLITAGDIYLEDTYRYRELVTSLVVSLALEDYTPFDKVIINGGVFNEERYSHHFDLTPIDIINKYGADVLRWWVASSNFVNDTAFGDRTLKQVSNNYKKIRNTFRYLINNIYDFDGNVKITEMEEIDLWAISKLDELVYQCNKHYEAYEFHMVHKLVYEFCTTELSSFYFDVSKDTLYCNHKMSNSRKSVQMAFYTIADTLARLLAPILVHLSEEVWGYIHKNESVHLQKFPVYQGGWTKDVLTRWQIFFNLRKKVNKSLEDAKNKGIIKNPMDACVTIQTSNHLFAVLLKELHRHLATLFLVSQVKIDKVRYVSEDEINVTFAEGEPCARCGAIKTEVGNFKDSPDLCIRCITSLKDKSPDNYELQYYIEYVFEDGSLYKERQNVEEWFQKEGNYDNFKRAIGNHTNLPEQIMTSGITESHPAYFWIEKFKETDTYYSIASEHGTIQKITFFIITEFKEDKDVGEL